MRDEDCGGGSLSLRRERALVATARLIARKIKYPNEIISG